MIKRSDFDEMARQAQEELLSGHISNAHCLLVTMATAAKSPELSQRLSSISEDYKRLLQFAQTGAEDAMRGQQYARIVRLTLSVLLDTCRAFRLQNSNDTYTRVRCSYSLQPQDDIFEILYAWKDEDAFTRQDAIFDLLWTAPQFRKEQEEQARLLLCTLDSLARQHAICALVVALMEYFDPAKLRLLLEYSSPTTPEEERAYAVVGILLAAHLHDSLIQLIPSLAAAVTELSLREELLLVQRDLVLTNGLNQIIKLVFSDQNGNPLSTEHLMARVPFMKRPCHWLAPFDPKRPEAEGASEGLVKLPLCASDKYTLAHLHVQLDLPELPVTPSCVLLALQGLCRFLTQSPWSQEMQKVFDPKIIFLECSLFSDKLYDDMPYLTEIGTQLLVFQRPNDALLHLKPALYRGEATSTLYAAIASCYRLKKEYVKALSYFQQAELLDEGNTQLLWAMEECYRRTCNFERQLQVLERLEQTDTEADPKEVLEKMAKCLVKMERYKEAQNIYYRLDFEHNETLSSTRGVGVCALHMGDWARAEKSYMRVIENFAEQAEWNDFLQAGNAVWMQGDTKRAITLYAQCIQLYMGANPKETNALTPFENCQDELYEWGKDMADIYIMHDILANRL